MIQDLIVRARLRLPSSSWLEVVRTTAAVATLFVALAVLARTCECPPPAVDAAPALECR